MPVDIKDKTPLKLRREDKREPPEPAATAHRKWHFRGADEKRPPGKGDAGLCHGILGHYI